MKDSDNIEKLFKDTFEHFEADVNPRVCANIQNGMHAASGSAASAAGKFAVGKIIAGIVSVAVISGTILYFSASDKTVIPAPEKQQFTEKPVQEKPAPVMNTQQQTPQKTLLKETRSYPQTLPPASRTLNHYSSDRVEHNPSISSTADVISTDVSTLENNSLAPSKPSGKYGNATQGDGGMIRGNQSANPSSSVNSAGSSADAQDENSDGPTVSIFANTFSGDAPLTVDFMSQNAASSLTWDFGDGTSSRESTPSHTFDKPGTYVVKLVAKNSSRSVSDKVTIEVRSVSSITHIPNIFTPNGDGENDVFFFDMKNITSIGVAIINQRTGELITQWNNLEGNWNGKLKNGADAPAGVYLYSIQAIGTDGVTHSEKGFVTISR